MDSNDLRAKFEACSSCNIMSMAHEYDPYSNNKNNGLLFDTTPMSIKKQPYLVRKRFMELIPGLTAHKLSFTCKKLYIETIKLRGINVRIDSFEQSPRNFFIYGTMDIVSTMDIVLGLVINNFDTFRVFHDGSIFVKLENIPKNLLSHMKIKAIDIGKYDANLEKIEKAFVFVAEKHETMKIVTDSNGKHYKFSHPGVKKAIINFCNDRDDVYETLKLLPNVQYAVLNFFCENNFLELQSVKEPFKKWVQTKPTPVISVFLDLYGDWYYFYDNMFYRVLGTEFIYVEDL